MLKASPPQQGKKLKRVELPDDLNTHTYQKALQFGFIYSLTGYIIGIAIILLGVWLSFRGINTHTDSVNIDIAGGISVDMEKFTPGILLFIVGLLIIFISRYSVKIKAKK